MPQLAAERGGHYLDQVTFAERATDWRGTINIAESIIEQDLAPHAETLRGSATTGEGRLSA